MQTDATSDNIVGSVGTCCVVHANERNAMPFWCSDPKKDCNVRAQTFSRGQHCCKSMQFQTGITMLRYFASPLHNNRNVRTCCAKSLTGFNYTQLISVNKCQHYCGSMQTDATCWAQQCCVLLRAFGQQCLRPFAWA